VTLVLIFPPQITSNGEKLRIIFHFMGEQPIQLRH
jgi:hypothetical protein